MCDMDCFNCKKTDCTNNTLTDAERKQQDARDNKARASSYYGKQLTQYEYNQSERGKARQKRYDQTEKGKANKRRKNQKCIASGKNAEYCRRYYAKKKAEREAIA